MIKLGYVALRAGSGRPADEEGRAACGAVDATIKSPRLNPIDTSLIGFQGTYSTNSLIHAKGKELYERAEAISHASIAQKMDTNEAIQETKMALVKFRKACLKAGYDTNLPDDFDNGGWEDVGMP